MSRSTERFEASELPAPICEYCGCPIPDTDQRCVALDEGVCSP